MRRTLPVPWWRSCAIAAAALGMLAIAPQATAAASWPVPVQAASRSQALAGTGPAAPANPTATCSLVADKIQVSWTAAPGATSYAVAQYQNGTLTTTATGITATSWTSGLLPAGSYTFRVTGYIGQNWAGTQSAATVARTITLALVCT